MRRYPTLEQGIADITETIQRKMEERSFRAANELRSSALRVLRGQRSGRRYKVPGTHRRQRDKVDGKMKNGRYYTASAPGEPLAVRTGVFRMSWQPTASRMLYGSCIARIESNAKTENGRYLLGQILEGGTGRMAPRPYQDRILEDALPKIMDIYSRAYFRGGRK